MHIDLQMHTVLSDGTWQPQDLLAHLKAHQFTAAAITDHDRVDTAAELQRLAARLDVRLLVAAELTTTWEGQLTDLLCYGFNPENPGLRALTENLLSRQQTMTREAGVGLEDLEAIVALPASQQPSELRKRSRQPGRATTPIEEAVARVREAGGVSLLAHPGRTTDGFLPFDRERLDRLRSQVPFDGLEVFYPKHTAAQVELFRIYACDHSLLVSAGSDSHGPERLPIAYPAELCHALLRRLSV